MAVVQLVNWPGIRDDLAAVEAVHRVAVTAGDVQSLSSPAMVRARQGDTAEARGLYQQAIEGGSVDALTSYAAFLPNFGARGAGRGDPAVPRTRRGRRDRGTGLAGCAATHGTRYWTWSPTVEQRAGILTVGSVKTRIA
jgi:hypothetical protein